MKALQLNQMEQINGGGWSKAQKHNMCIMGGTGSIIIASLLLPFGILGAVALISYVATCTIASVSIASCMS